MAGKQASRLARLESRWAPFCPECAKRPAVVYAAWDEECPAPPLDCPACGRRHRPVICLVGVDREAI